jgi:hypothetical protein
VDFLKQNLAGKNIRNLDEQISSLVSCVNSVNDFVSLLKNKQTTVIELTQGIGRQFIFATHNQNITVLADSEKIFYLSDMSTEKEGDVLAGEVKACGGLDREEVKQAVISLEGGADAFYKRKQKYGFA